MPVVVRDSGMMWNKDDALEDVKCLIPDRCYARMYKTVMDDCRENGQFDVSTMGKFLIFTWVVWGAVRLKIGSPLTVLEPIFLKY